MRRALLFFAVAWGCGDEDSSPAPAGTIDDDGDGAALGVDCDDDDALVHPGAEEHCNGTDDDCDGPVDEDAVDAITVFTDADSDGFGDAEAGTACVAEADQSAVGGDCDDLDPARHPDALEICNGGIDDDCDGAVDDDDDPARTTAYYSDLDGDGFGGGAPVQSCEPVEDLLEDGSDCDDGNPSVHPGAPELCNDFDDDCDAVTTETGVVSVEGVAYWEIQPALDAATEGAVVSLCEGTWYENVFVDKDVVLEGRGPELSIIDGNGAGSVIAVRTMRASLTLRGLTLQHGTGEEVHHNWVDAIAGGGVQAARAGALTIEDCVIADNTAEVGAGVLGPGEADSLVTDTVIRGNDAADTGGGAYFGNGDDWTTEIRDSEITDNTAGCEAGGLELAVLYEPGTTTLSDTLIDGNIVTPTDFDCSVSTLRGGGIYSSVFVLLNAVTISNNVAGDGGGVFMRLDVTADDKTVVSGNSTHEGGAGGGVAIDIASSSGEYYFPDHPATWRYGTIEGNTASYGGGVALLDECILRDATVQGNSATVSGGGVWIEDFQVTVRDSTISSNSSDGVGGGIGTDDTSGTPLLENVAITSNTAKVAGGGARVEMNIESVGCDWGAGGTENSPDDVSVYADKEEVSYDLFGALEDFVCTVSELVCE